MEEIIAEKILSFYIILPICFSLNLLAGFYEISISKFYCNETFLWVANNKGIIFKQFIAVFILKFWVVGSLSEEIHSKFCVVGSLSEEIHSKFCVVGSLSEEIHSISTPRFRCIICAKIWKCDHQYKKDVTDNNHKSRAVAQKNLNHIFVSAQWYRTLKSDICQIENSSFVNYSEHPISISW